MKVKSEKRQTQAGNVYVKVKRIEKNKENKWKHPPMETGATNPVRENHILALRMFNSFTVLRVAATLLIFDVPLDNIEQF
jgi:hypothetical protein